MQTPLRVGVIGVNAKRGWARESHIPAVKAVDGLTLAAVGTSSQASAEEAAAAFEVGKAYGSPAAMFADPDIDVVTVAASVPAHHDLILEAVRAGKHVYSEWPLGVGTARTEEIAHVATETGVQRLLLDGKPQTVDDIRRSDATARRVSGRHSSLTAIGPSSDCRWTR